MVFQVLRISILFPAPNDLHKRTHVSEGTITCPAEVLLGPVGCFQPLRDMVKSCRPLLLWVVDHVAPCCSMFHLEETYMEPEKPTTDTTQSTRTTG